MAKTFSHLCVDVRRDPSQGIPLPFSCLSLSKSLSQSCQMKAPYSVEGLQKGLHPLVVPQYPIDDAPTGSDALNRDFDQGIEKAQEALARRASHGGRDQRQPPEPAGARRVSNGPAHHAPFFARRNPDGF